MEEHFRSFPAFLPLPHFSGAAERSDSRFLSLFFTFPRFDQSAILAFPAFSLRSGNQTKTLQQVTVANGVKDRGVCTYPPTANLPCPPCAAVARRTRGKRVLGRRPQGAPAPAPVCAEPIWDLRW